MPRLIDLAEPTPGPSRDRFVGRERERREFRNSVHYLLDKEAAPGGSPLYPHIFLPHGEGGMGKSALLRQFVRIAREEGLAEAQIVILDLDSDSYPTAEALAQKIASATRRTSPEFDRRYRAAQARRDELAPRMRELKEQWVRWEALRGSSDADIDNLLDAHHRTLRHTEEQQASFGLAALPYMAAQAYESRNELVALLAFRKERGRVPDTLDELLERELGADDAALFLHERGLGQALADDLFVLAEASPLLLAIDTYELADRPDDPGTLHLRGWVRANWATTLARWPTTITRCSFVLMMPTRCITLRVFIHCKAKSTPRWIGWRGQSREMRATGGWHTPTATSIASAPTRASWRWWAMRARNNGTAEAAA